ncbi:MAG: hypothetical protein HKP52_05010 [Desulfofustis sp.]|nr:hypothetical protein [Desulfofustis sp.]
MSAKIFPWGKGAYPDEWDTYRYQFKTLDQARSERVAGGAALQRYEQAAKRVTQPGKMFRTYGARYS